MTLTELFTNIANAIRAKTGSTEPIIAEDFPSAIEAIPVGSTIDLDAEVTEQETIAASQDTLVGDIMAALEGKAIGSGGEISLVTTTISEEQVEDGPNTLTIPELIGAKYFIIQGNPLTAHQTDKLTKMDDAGVFYQLIYLNGTKIAITCDSLGGSGAYASLGIRYNTPNFDFETTTGAVSSTISYFKKFSVDTSTTGVVYTVYRLG
jgi:hypothetical protein